MIEVQVFYLPLKGRKASKGIIAGADINKAIFLHHSCKSITKLAFNVYIYRYAKRTFSSKFTKLFLLPFSILSLGMYFINTICSLGLTINLTTIFFLLFIYIVLLAVYYIIKQQHKEGIFFGVMGFTYVFYIIFIRLLLERLPKDIPTHLNYFSIVFYMILLLLFIFSILILLRSFLIDKGILKQNPNSIFLRLGDYFSTIYKIGLLFVHQFVMDELSKYFSVGDFLHKITSFIYIKIGFANIISFSFKFFVCWYYIPICIYLLGFIIDVFFLGSFNLIYKFSPLLLLPLIYRYLLFQLRIFIQGNIKNMNTNMIYFRKVHKIPGKPYLGLGPIITTEEHLLLSNTFTDIPDIYSEQYALLLHDDFKKKKQEQNTDLLELSNYLFDRFCFYMQMNQVICLHYSFQHDYYYNLIFAIICYIILILIFGYILYNGM
jgi:hypothetical protein